MKGILETVVRDGTVNAKMYEASGVEVVAGDGRRKFIYVMPSEVPPEVAVAVDVRLCHVYATK